MQCIWSAYFVCADAGPTRDFWFACDPTGEFTVRSMHTTRENMFNANDEFLGGYVLLHIHYSGTADAPEKQRPRHVNARFAFSR